MPSQAFQDLRAGLAEVTDILSVDPTPLGGLSPEPKVTRAVTRAALVMLCGHFERYIRGSIEEAVGVLNTHTLNPDLLPTGFKLVHSREPLRRLLETSWKRREKPLIEFLSHEAWLWIPFPSGELDSRRLLETLKTPMPKRVTRVYAMRDVEDIFGRITRARHTRRRFWLHLTDLVEKRNNIAHGDLTVETTRGDVQQYLKDVAEFCRRADGVLARVLRRWGVPCSW